MIAERVRGEITLVFRGTRTMVERTVAAVERFARIREERGDVVLESAPIEFGTLREHLFPKEMYEGQHPAERTLDLLAASLRDHTRGDTEKVLRAQAEIELYFHRKAS